MTGPIYKLWMFKWTEAGYRLSEEEQQGNMAKLQAAYEKVGGKQAIACVSRWSAEQWLMFGLDEFPDIDAVQEFHELLEEYGHFRYVDSVSMLGTKWEPW